MGANQSTADHGGPERRSNKAKGKMPAYDGLFNSAPAGWMDAGQSQREMSVEHSALQSDGGATYSDDGEVYLRRGFQTVDIPERRRKSISPQHSPTRAYGGLAQQKQTQTQKRSRPSTASNIHRSDAIRRQEPPSARLGSRRATMLADKEMQQQQQQKYQRKQPKEASMWPSHISWDENRPKPDRSTRSSKSSQSSHSSQKPLAPSSSCYQPAVAPSSGNFRSRQAAQQQTQAVRVHGTSARLPPPFSGGYHPAASASSSRHYALQPQPAQSASQHRSVPVRVPAQSEQSYRQRRQHRQQEANQQQAAAAGPRMQGGRIQSSDRRPSPSARSSSSASSSSAKGRTSAATPSASRPAASPVNPSPSLGSTAQKKVRKSRFHEDL